MKNKTLIIAWREYWSRVSTLSFWLSTLAFPVMFIVISLISGLGSSSLEDLEDFNLDNIEGIVLISDQSNLISLPPDLPSEIVLDNQISKQSAIAQVQSEEIDAFIYYPPDLIDSRSIEVYSQDNGLIGNDKYNGFARDLIKAGAADKVQDPDILVALQGSFNTSVTAYKDGEPVNSSIFNLAFPIIGLILYMILVLTGSQFMLQSVAEEKENRIIEIILSTVKSSQLILGKLIGLSGVVLTQLLALGSLSILVLLVMGTLAAFVFPVEFGALGITPEPIFLSVLAIIIGFLTMSALMIGVAAITPNYRDAQSFSGFFVFLSVTPSIFFAMILGSPDGTVAQILTYIPLAGPLTIVLRSALDAIDLWEVILSMAVNISYMIFTIFMSFKLFEIGALQFKDRLTFKQIFSIFLKY